MKKVFFILLLFLLLIQATLVSSRTEPVDKPPTQESSSMPGRPIPDKLIPHHEPGHLAKADGYTSQVNQLNSEGIAEMVELTGFDAMLADETITDPFQGNYRVVEENQLFFGAVYTSNLRLQTADVYSDTAALDANLLDGTERLESEVMQSDVAAGDLNGDGIDEQLTAWLDDNGHVHLTIDEMPVSSELPDILPPKVTSAPAAIAQPDGSIDLLVRGYDDALWYHDGVSWQNAGGRLLSAPTAASRTENEFDVFAVGQDDNIAPDYLVLWHRHWNGTSWENWQQLDDPDETSPPSDWPTLARNVPTPELSAPAVVVNESNELIIFWLWPDNTLRWCLLNDTVCETWQDLGGMLASGPGAVAHDGQIDVFARGMDDALWTRTYVDNWGAWQRVDQPGMPAGVSIASAPAVVSPAVDEMMVMVRGSDDQLWQLNYDGSSWGNWIVAPATPSQNNSDLVSTPALVTNASQSKLFVTTNNGHLRSANYDGSSWINWQTETPLPNSTHVDLTDSDVVNHPAADIQFPIHVETGHFMGADREFFAIAYARAADLHIIVNLYDIRDGFVPKWLDEDILDAEFNSSYISGSNKFDLSVGDLDGNGQDELIISSVEKGRSDDLRVNVFGINQGSLDEIGSPWFALEKSAMGAWEYVSTAVATGNFDGLSNDDEVAIKMQGVWWDGRSTTYSHLYVLDHNETEGNNICTPRPDEPWFDSCIWYTTENCRISDVAAVDMYTSANDLKSKIAWDKCAFSDDYMIVEIFEFENDDHDDVNLLHQWDNIPVNRLKGNSGRLFGADLNGDLQEDLAIANCSDGSCELRLFSIGMTTLSDAVNLGTGQGIALAAGDFIGESIRVGPPSYRVQEEMTSPVVFLNLPPMHRDIISGSGEIVINNGATAKHIGDESENEVYSSGSNKEWELSTGFETSVGGGGHQVSASLENSYGEQFSESGTQINEITVSDETTAELYDQVIYNATDYAIWEYPVYGAEADNPDQAQTISVVWPLVETVGYTNLPQTRNGDWCDENFYTPSHQAYNVWSYGDIKLGVNAFADLDEYILTKQTTGGNKTKLQIWEAAEVATSASFHNQISAGLEYSYETEFNIPLIGNAWDFSFRAYANGSYGHENFSTFSSEVTEKTGVEIDIPSLSNLPIIDAYMYWAKGGYLVVDYLTRPGTGGSWGLYNKSDPAFILPWYGFPDAGTGIFPAPPDPDAPSCGLDKQLFTHDIELEPATIQNGETVTMTATVRNFSSVVPPNNVTVSFYLGYPDTNNQIGTCTIPRLNLNRTLGPQQCTTTWVVSDGSGEEKIFARLDPYNTFDEMHDEDDFIDNNIGYGLLHVAGADYFDPGLRQAQPYQAIHYEEAEGLGFDLYLPTTNITSTETIRYEVVPTELGDLNIVGKPIQVLAFSGGEQNPAYLHHFGSIPAGVMVYYRDSDLLSGMDEATLKLYRLDGSEWVEATCSGYAVERFLTDNMIAFPICQTGTFVLTNESFVTEMLVYLPIVLKP